MNYLNRRLAADAAFDRTIWKLSAGKSLDDTEITQLVTGASGMRSISFHQYRSLQMSLGRVRPHGRATRTLIAAFLNKGYEYYLRSVDALRAARTLNGTYKVDHIPKTTAHDRRPGTAMTPQYLTIHSTGNPASTSGGERSWLTNAQNIRTASFHVVVDAAQVVECIPFNEVAWHAGDGSGSGNTKSISLEICESGDRERTLQNAIALTAKILRDQSLDPDSLRRHHDWATKTCPRILIVDENRHKPHQTWEWFKTEVENLS